MRSTLSGEMVAANRRQTLVTRGVLLGLPAVAVLVASILVLGPGETRPVVAVRVWGTPAADRTSVALRVMTLEKRAGVVSPRADVPLVVELPGLSVPPWRGRTGSDGTAEVDLASEELLVGEAPLRVSSDRTLLVSEHIHFRPAPAHLRPAAPLVGVAHGELAITATLPRGVLSPPFPEALVVEVRDAHDDPAAEVSVVSAGLGVDVTPQVGRTDAAGRLSLSLVVQGPNPELQLSAFSGSGPHRRDATPDGTWEGPLPSVPSAMWVEPRPPAAGTLELSVVSASPRPRAYVSLLSNRGREQGAIVELAESGGFYRGTHRLPAPPSEWLAVTVASDPGEQSPSTVTWPLAPDGGVVDAPPLELLVDGLPVAERHELARAYSAKRSAVAVLGTAAFVEVLLLLLGSRAAGRALQDHLRAAARHSDPEDDEKEVAAVARRVADSGGHGALPVALALVVAIGFGVIAALALMR